MRPKTAIGKVAGAASLTALCMIGCDSSTTTVGDPCMIEPLPLTGSASGPTVTDVGLEIQTGEGVIVVATATHPDGTPAFENVTQSVGVFPDSMCSGPPVTLQDDLAGSGLEETFGTAVSATDDPGLFDAIRSQDTWPVEIDFRDVDGNRVTGRVLARVIR